jgi:hypothetical protein
MAMLAWFVLGVIWLLGLRAMGRFGRAYSMTGIPSDAEETAPMVDTA